MATSRLEVFKTSLKITKNAKIDDIDAFLDDIKYSIKMYDNSTYQYQRINLESTFKITATQEESNSNTFGNYARLTQDGKKFYFFITDQEWLSANSCALNVYLDTINTFVDELEWSDKTMVMREHEDRYSTYENVSYYADFINESTTGTTLTKTTTKTFSSLKGKNKVTKIVAEFYPTVSSLKQQLDKVVLNNFDSKKGEVTFTTTFSCPTAGTKFVGPVRYSFYYQGLKRKIDFISEGINPALYGKDIGTIYDKNDSESWYVIYNSNSTTQQSEKEPIDTLLCKDSGFTAMIRNDATTNIELAPGDIGGDYYFVEPFNGTGRFNNISPYFHGWEGDLNPQFLRDELGTDILRTDCVKSASSEFDRTDLISFVFSKEGNRIAVDRVDFKVVGLSAQGYGILSTEVTTIGYYNKINISSNAAIKVFEIGEKPTAQEKGIEQYNKYVNSPLFPISGSEKSPQYIYGIESLKRTTPTLIKVIKLPYCPINYTVDSDGRYNFDLNVQTHKAKESLGGDFLFIDNIYNFGSKLNTDIENPVGIITKDLEFTASPMDDKDIKYESKLYHSEFYQAKFIYDSFGFNFDLEKISETTSNDTLQLNFIPSRLFNSAMLFEFPEYKTAGKDVEDYNNILIANRNNEMPIYNSDYLNYIKTGYNYDVKVKNANTKYGAIQTGLSFISSGVQGALGFLSTKPIKSNPRTGLDNFLGRPAKNSTTRASNLFAATSKTGAIQTGTSAISSIVGLIQQNEMAQMAIDQKKKVLANQSVSVSDCDSIDLLEKYSGNKAKMKVYTPEEKTKELLFDLFYYTGYTRGIRKLPNTNNRYWFNYVECEPVFIGKSSLIYADYIADIQDRYSEGITIYHHHPEQTAMPYDIDQVKENWETNLV